MLIHWLDQFVDVLVRWMPEGTLLSYPNIMRGQLAVILVCLICGAVGSLVVGNRMAFFSDALAHCAFAGVALGLLVGVLTRAVSGGPFDTWGIPVITVTFGVLVGVAIAYVKEKTVLANDTVIGVFFAGAIGFGAMLFKALSTRSFRSAENFLFGDPLYIGNADLLELVVLFVLAVGVLFWIYNQLVFASFNPSLARSRQMRLRLCNYVFIILLALIVNLSLRTVGALLINGLLVVPAAAAGNISKNMRHMFWLSIFLSLMAGIFGSWLSNEVGFRDPATGERTSFGWGGSIVVLSVLFFFASMLAGPWLRGRQTA
jgi:zinc transport system permease protein